MAVNYLPVADAKLLAWTATFLAHVKPQPKDWGLADAIVAAYDAAQDRFAKAFAVAQDRVTRSPANIELLREARVELVRLTRQAVDVCQAWPEMTDAKRSTLGIPVRHGRRPGPTPPPSVAPLLEVVDMDGRTMTLALRRTDGKRGRPADVAQATVMTCVGDEPATTVDGWTFQGNTTRTEFTVAFPPTLAPGTKVWATAIWSNRRAQSGPPATPVCGWIQYGAVIAQAA